jgi:molybdopterin-guanine dinucleotide biosynthesis protein A
MLLLPPATGAVMAGGKSSRLGRDKALLTLEGETLLERAVRTLQETTAEQIVVGPPERRDQSRVAKVYQDLYPSSGPLGGIYTALHFASNPLVLVVACDMPFLNADLLRLLLSLADGYDVVLPVPDGRGEQLHAVYRTTCQPAIEQQIASGDFKIDRFFDRARVRRVDVEELRQHDPELRSFRNVNTPEDWAETQALL